MEILKSKIPVKALITAMIIIITSAFSSCEIHDDDDYYAISGYWVYEGDEYGGYTPGQENEFFFAPDGSGTYSCYSDNGYGPWTTYPIDWWISGDYITIQVSNWDVWTYSYDLTRGWLYLYPSSGPYLIYSRN